MTGKEMCELISEFFASHGVNKTWEEIWNYSPTGELFMIYEWYEDAKVWNETEKGKQQLLEIINKKFSFGKDGTIYCRECKNETVACVCMDEEE